MNHEGTKTLRRIYHRGTKTPRISARVIVKCCGSPRELGGVLLLVSLGVLTFLLHAVDEADTGSYQWQQRGSSHRSPARFRHASSVNAILSAFVREPAPVVTRCRHRTVAKGDSMMLVVRRWRQCCAGTS